MKKMVFCALLALVGIVRGAHAADSAHVRNVILLIGDGMGLAQVSMLEMENEYAPTAFNRAQHIALMATRSTNNRVTDSAAASTAMATGTRTANGHVGVDSQGQPLQSVMKRASNRGLRTGIVVTSALQHATPAAFYAQNRSRDDMWGITRDLLGSRIDVLIGGGEEWLEESCAEGDSYLDAFRRRGYVVCRSLAEASDVHRGRLLCVAAEEHLPVADKRGDFLPRGVEKALELLSAGGRRADKGFLLLVEGSQIDMAGHARDAQQMLGELRDFERAVAVAMDFADRTPGTLVIVAADHETGGLSLPGNEDDFTQAESGVQIHFASGRHSAIRVPVYFYGAGADRFGALIENTDLAPRIAALLGLK